MSATVATRPVGGAFAEGPLGFGTEHATGRAMSQRGEGAKVRLGRTAFAARSTSSCYAPIVTGILILCQRWLRVPAPKIRSPPGPRPGGLFDSGLGSGR